MKLPKFIFLFLSLPVAIASSIIGFGYIHQTRPIGILFAIVLGLISFIPVLIFFLVKAYRTEGAFSKTWLGLFCIVIMVGLGAGLFSKTAGANFHKNSVDEAKTILEEFIPMVEEFHTANGVYPMSLTEIGVYDVEKDGSNPLINYQIYQCRHIFLYEVGEIPESRPSADNHYVSNGGEYELCFHNLDAYDTVGTITVYYRGDQKWATRLAYGAWELGQGRN